MAYAHHLGHLGRYDESVAEGRRAVTLDPKSTAIARELFWVLFNARLFAEAAVVGRQFVSPERPAADAARSIVGF